MKQIKLAYEDLRKDYPNNENLDKICPMWVHFKIPRNYSRKEAGLLSGKVDISILDAKDGTTLGSIKKIKQINQLRNTINMLPNNSDVIVSIKADKDTPMGDITEIKQVLRGYYMYKLNMEKKE